MVGKTQATARFWQLDAVRGATVVLMLIFNWSFALKYFGILELVSASNSFYWWLFPRLVAFSFIFIAGFSVALLRHSMKRKQLPAATLRRRFLFRGIKLFTLGLSITAATYFFVPSDFIFFGILHLMGVATLLALLFFGREGLLLPFGFLAVFAGALLEGRLFSFPWLAWLGFYPQGISTLDYFPLLPWAGFFLLAFWLGSRLYPKISLRLSRNPGITPLLFAPLLWLGRHSLAVYLVHQPLLLLALKLLGYPLPF